MMMVGRVLGSWMMGDGLERRGSTFGSSTSSCNGDGVSFGYVDSKARVGKVLVSLWLRWWWIPSFDTTTTPAVWPGKLSFTVALVRVGPKAPRSGAGDDDAWGVASLLSALLWVHL